jgi:oligoendopeptidase F
MDSVASFFEKAYDDLTVGDIEYPYVREPSSGKEIQANNTNYYLALLNPDRNFRKDFFQKLLGTYRKHSNTLTSLYFGTVKKNVIEARKRNYARGFKNGSPVILLRKIFM